MKAALVFDSVNDLVFGKWDSAFIERMKTFGVPVSFSICFRDSAYCIPINNLFIKCKQVALTI